MEPLIIFHPREKLQKCTLWPLVEERGWPYRVFPDVDDLAWDDALCLAPEGEPLSREDGDKTLVLVDGTWRLAARIAARIPSPRRSLPGFVSAYPRTSKLFRDPPGGLASAEALYAATLLLGRRDDSLLRFYRWKDDFLRLNRRRILDLAGREESA